MRILFKEDSLVGLIAENMVKKDLPVLNDTTKLDEALKLFEITDFNMLPVLDDKNNMLLGVVHQEEAFAYYRKQLNLYGSDQYESKKL